MYLEKLTITNFRKLKNVEFKFTSGLNIIVGANNVGKTAFVDALRSLLAGHEEPYPRITFDDIHRPQDGSDPSGDITFQFIFADLSFDDEADFLPALIPSDDGSFKANITVSYSPIGTTGRMKPKRWCGEFDEISLNSDMLENLRGVYLQPLRDASQGLKPGRNSKLAKLLRLLGENDDCGKSEIEKTLQEYDKKLEKTSPIESTRNAILSRHENMLGEQLAQILKLNISGTNFNRLSARLNIQADNFDIDQNGLGFNNLIYMAVVLSEMARDPSAAYRGLIVEEPEAHLHPQLQSVLLDYLESVHAEEGEGEVQVFVTSHSPNFASIANLESTICLMNSDNMIKTFFPRDVIFSDKKSEQIKSVQKLERYLDVTRAELFFAQKVIFVEGAAELMLISVLANCLGKEYNLRKHGISLISVEGLNFDCFLPLFGEKALQIPVSAITDADSYILNDSGNKTTVYPDLGDDIEISDNTVKLKEYEDKLVKVFHGLKTLEYDLALYEENREIMLSALTEFHPQISKKLKEEVNEASTNQEKAKTLFCGMFERGESLSNVQKGRYGQVLAQHISEKKDDFIVPEYIKNAIEHVCK